MRVFKWGKSLAVKFTKDEARALGIEVGQDIKIVAADDRRRLSSVEDKHGG